MPQIKKIQEIDYDSIGIDDDYLFSELMRRNKNICKRLLELIIEEPIREIKVPEREKPIRNGLLNKGVRLDVYVEGTDAVYNIEMQTSNQHNLGKRTRYYQGSLDLDLIKKGEEYNSLKKTFIIFICTFDFCERGRLKYTFERVCKEEPNLKLGDDTTVIVLNATSVLDDNCNEDLVAFMRYVNDHEAIDNDFVRTVDDALNKLKENEDIRRERMTLAYKLKETEERGYEKGVVETAKKMLRKGADIEFVVECTGLTYEEVQKLKEEL